MLEKSNKFPLYLSAVYSWGRGDLGQLGLGDEGNYSQPTLIPNLADKDILHIAASDFHSAFLTGVVVYLQ
jgi:alpha-tubulin suppressor-like RCC1 family protein